VAELPANYRANELDWHSKQGLRWRELGPFGVEIDQDLAEPLGPAAADRFVGLLRDHSLIVAHGQSLDRAQQTALLGLIGPVVPHRDGETGYIQSDGKAGHAGSELAFHADAAYTETPFEALSLHAVDVVDGASSTLFIDAQGALERLSPMLRAQLAGLDAEMMSGAVDRLGARLCEMREDELPLASRVLPAIRIHPRTGRAYVAVSAMHTACLAGMNRQDSTALLTAVFDEIYAPAHIHEHVWHGGDLVIWDNVACQHARGPLDKAGRRILQRVIVGPHAHAAPQIQVG
jgi:taurine dioxygenase